MLENKNKPQVLTPFIKQIASEKKSIDGKWLGGNLSPSDGKLFVRRIILRLIERVKRI